MPTGPYKRSIGWSLVFAFLALALGALFVYPRQWTRGFMINDEAWYAEPARNIAQGRGFSTETVYPMVARGVTSLPIDEPFKQVGYPLVVAWASRVTGTLNDRLFIVVALIGMAFTGMATWLVADALVRNRTVAGVITLATIGNPSFWSYWAAALPESLFTAFFLGGIYLLLCESAAACAGSGVLLVASMYFKGFSVLYLPLAVGFLLFAAREKRVRLLTSFVSGVVATLALAAVFLPTATRQLSGASGSYAGSMLLFETRGAYPAVEGPFYDISPLNPFTYIAGHPLDYAEKVARMVSRTKGVMGELGGPGFGNVLFLVLLFVALAVAQDLFSRVRNGWTPDEERGDIARTQLRSRLLLAGLLAVNFAFFWAGNFKARYFAHLFPLLLAAAVLEFERLVPRAKEGFRRTPGVIALVAVGYFLVYPPVAGLWGAYRDPYAFLGRMLPVRWVDYREVAKNVNANVPEHGMVMSDMAHEISWYTGRPTVFFPGNENQVTYLLDKFDVRALYLHPRVTRRWPVLLERFRLVDDRNGEFWVRRD